MELAVVALNLTDMVLLVTAGGIPTGSRRCVLILQVEGRAVDYLGGNERPVELGRTFLGGRLHPVLPSQELSQGQFWFWLNFCGLVAERYR